MSTVLVKKYSSVSSLASVSFNFHHHNSKEQHQIFCFAPSFPVPLCINFLAKLAPRTSRHPFNEHKLRENTGLYIDSSPGSDKEYE
jgi:hypothetical protein